MSVYKKETTKEEMKQEAILRMERLGLDSQIVQSFREEGAVSLSEQVGQRILLLLTDTEVNEEIQRFEEEYECLVYHVLRADNPMAGECRSLLFVSPTASDWNSERSYIDSSVPNTILASSRTSQDSGCMRFQAPTSCIRFLHESSEGK